jgi:transcriptional regulator with XRE-family HTH domain
MLSSQHVCSTSSFRCILLHALFRLALGSAIRTVRSRQHLSQKDLSTLAGVERSHLSRIETGFEPSPRFCTVVRLLRALGVTLVLRVEMNRSPQQEQRRRS